MKTLGFAITFLLIAFSSFLLTSCETENPAGAEILRIEPSEVTLQGSDKTVIFEALGGKPPYEWSVSDTTKGTISGTGPIVTYSRSNAEGANTVKVTDSHKWSATAQITQIGDVL